MKPKFIEIRGTPACCPQDHAAAARQRQAYKGINVLMLWGDAELKGFVCPIWMTFPQAQELGAHVRKGEHGSLVVYADKITRAETGDDGEEMLRQIAFMKGYTCVIFRLTDGWTCIFSPNTWAPRSR